MTIAGFIGANTYAEFLAAVLFSPLAFYFLNAILPQRKNALVIPLQKPLSTRDKPIVKKEELKPVKAALVDLDRRKFIKLIGSAGLSLFILALFTRRAHGAFFGSVPGPGTVALKDTTGAQIDPAIKHPTDGYKIARLDESDSIDTNAYYGFLRSDGAWFIMREESDGTYKYAKGGANFISTGWDVRNTTLSYAEYNTVFG